MGWILHERTNVRHSAPSVRVTRSGRSMHFTAAAADQLRNVKALTVFADNDSSSGWVAFQPVPLDHPHGYALHHTNAAAWIECLGFIRAQNLHPHAAWTLRWTDNDPAAMIIGEPSKQQPASAAARIAQIHQAAISIGRFRP